MNSAQGAKFVFGGGFYRPIPISIPGKSFGKRKSKKRKSKKRKSKKRKSKKRSKKRS